MRIRKVTAWGVTYLWFLALQYGLAVKVWSAEYEITKIADSNCLEFFCDHITFFGFHPAINDKGTVTFFTGSEGIACCFVSRIIRADKQTFTTIADTTNPLFAIGGLRGSDHLISMNNAGIVVFEAVLTTGGVGIFTGDGKRITSVAHSFDSGPFIANMAAINNKGAVAFSFFTPVEKALKIIHGSKTTIFDTTASDVSFFGPPAISDANTVVFRGSLDDGTFGIFTINERRLTTVATVPNGFTNFFIFPSINNAGRVVFAARLIGGGSGIFTADGTTITRVADTNGAFAFFDVGGWDTIGPAINDVGAVAFAAILDDGRQGIFVGPDPVADRVIVTGDLLFGSPVIEVFFARHGLNNRGQLVFWAVLADGTEGIYKANPVRRPDH